MSTKIVAPLLIVEGGNHHFWRVWPDGRIQYVENLDYASVLALTPHPTLTVAQLANTEPYEIGRYTACPQCNGTELVERLVRYRGLGWDEDNVRIERELVAIYERGSEDEILDELHRGEHLELTEVACPDCQNGIALEWTGTFVEAHQLAQQVAA